MAFDIPIAIFFFNRDDLVLKVIEKVRSVKPRKLYLFCDAGRDDEEKRLVLSVRAAVESAVNWDCEIVKNYADSNRGVYDSIGMGAKWLFEQEDVAIFLEDDNLPDVSFFEYCRVLLEKYKNDGRVLWICGTNYLGEYEPSDGASYMFTQHLLPCGWASWSKKFLSYYDGELKGLDTENAIVKLKNNYRGKALFDQQLYSIFKTKENLRHDRRTCSWDYQMAFSLRFNDMYGISPKFNLIENIGADERSTHGGTSRHLKMTRRFCGVETKSLSFPLKHPHAVKIDERYEKRIEHIILLPFFRRCVTKIVRRIKPLFGFEKYESVNISSFKKKLSKRADR